MSVDSTSNLDTTLEADLATLRDLGLERNLRLTAKRHGATVETKNGPAIDFSSNDYLGLATDPRLIDAAVLALKEHGVGATASRLISGDTPEHEALERDTAAFFNAERALTFSSGFAANVGTIPALVGRGDAIFADALNHASLIDGSRLSRAAIHVFPHADVHGLAALLEQHRSGARRALIVTDGLFSMDGDLAPLAELTPLAKRFDAWTYVDDAHAVGVLGDTGRGSAELAGLHGEIDITVGTFGKAFGAAGAFVYGSATLGQYLLNKARSFIFSTAPLPAQAAACRASLRVVAEDAGRRERVAANAQLMRRALADGGIETRGAPVSPIIPVVIGSTETTMHVGSTLAALGYLVGAVRPPTVPEGTSRLRITVTAAHGAEQIISLADALADVLRA